MFILNPFASVIKFYKSKVLSTTLYTFDILLKVCVVVLILATFFAVSVFLYLAFYNAHVPSVMHVNPIHLYYESCKGGREECPYPRGHVQLTKDGQLLMVGQSYKMSVILEMPESPANKETGMFMVCGELVSKNKLTVAHSCRSASLKYKSPLVHLLTTLFFAPFYVWGSMEEKQTRTVQLLDNFNDDQAYPVTDIFIELKAYKVEVYSAMLQINAHMAGLRYVMYYWRSTSAVVGITFIFAFLTFIVSMSLWQLYGPHNQLGREYLYGGIDRLTPFKFSGRRLKVSTVEKEAKEEEDFEDVPSAKTESVTGTKFLKEAKELETSSEA